METLKRKKGALKLYKEGNGQTKEVAKTEKKDCILLLSKGGSKALIQKGFKGRSILGVQKSLMRLGEQLKTR